MNKTEIELSGNEVGVQESTRRTFLKRSGGATLATLVAWNAMIQPLMANTEGSATYLVCTAAPTRTARAPQPFLDYGLSRTDGTTIIHRRKTDTYEGIGPDVGDYREIDPDAETKFQVTGKLGTYIAAESGGWAMPDMNRLSVAEITQDIVVRAGGTAIEYRANDAVYQVLNGAGGPTSNLDSSPITGGIGIEKGAVKAKTVWAGYQGTGGVNLSVTVGILNFSPIGISRPADQSWTAPPLYWKFDIMTLHQLEAFLLTI